jgi:nickel/cobalt exporter
VRRTARRAALLALPAAALLLALAAPAGAHPLGNFTVNHYSGLRLQPGGLAVDYVLDLAEIPTYQARRAIDRDHDGRVGAAEAAAWRDRTCARLAAGARARLDGHPLPLAVAGARLAFPAGVGGLATTRLECALAAPLPAGRGAHQLAYADGNDPGRVGWREITAVGDGATLDAADVPAASASARLTAYPADQLRSPLDQRTASLRFRPGGPRAAGGPAPAARGGAVPATVDRATGAFTALVARRRLSPGFGLLAVLLGLALGGVHALAPGHGKTVIAAYLVGLRGSPRQAAAIAATVTVTHTAGVLGLGVLLTASRAVASERLYPLLGLASGLLLAAVGVGLVRRALGGHHDHEHPHGHTRPVGRRGLLLLGLAGGLVPSPSAVVVLLGGVALGHAWFGLALVLAYGAGMAAALTGIGLLLAGARGRVDRRLDGPAGALLARAGRLLPLASASLIVLVGLTLAARGAAQL